jgi:two-component system alkaline phosphatase synthesis response regulator PhoP
LLRPICPSIIVGTGTYGPEIGDALARVGAPVLAKGPAARLSALLEEHSPTLVVLDGTSSLADFAQACRLVSQTRHPLRPMTLGAVTARLLPELEGSTPIDDIIVWPAQPEELELRIARVRWQKLGLSREGLIRTGGLLLDIRRHQVVADGEEIALTVREYELLRALVEAKGRLLTREHLLESVWGEDYLGGERTVDIHIRRLRAKIPELADRISTVRGYGYRLADPEE